MPLKQSSCKNLKMAFTPSHSTPAAFFLLNATVAFSRKKAAGVDYDAHDKELAGAGRPFLLGAKHAICVRTNHKNLQYFRQPRRYRGDKHGGLNSSRTLTTPSNTSSVHPTPLLTSYPVARTLVMRGWMFVTSSVPRAPP